MFRALAATFIILSAGLLAAENISPLALRDLRFEQLAWQAQEGAKVEVKQAAAGVGVSMAFAKPSVPVWTAHLAVEDWSAQGTLLLDFEPGDAAAVVVGLRDIYGTSAACPVSVPAAGGVVKVPLASFYLQGIMPRYVKSMAFWTQGPGACAVTLKGVSLSAEGFSADWPRASVTLMNADRPQGRMVFGYSKPWVAVSTEHAADGHKTFLCRLPKGKWLNTFGIVQHDWRNFTSVSFDFYRTQEGEGALRFIIRDAWVKGTGNNVEASAEVKVKSGANCVTIPLSEFKTQARFDLKTPTAAPTLPIQWEYIHQVGWMPLDGDAVNTFCVSNLRLEGAGKLSPEQAAARSSMPAWGYDRLAKVDVPGSFEKVELPAPGDKTSLEMGAAKAKITPALDTPMSEDRKVTGVLDDLYIRAAVFKEGERKMLLLVVDTLYAPAIPEIATGCSEAVGVSKANVFYCCTHNHNAGAPYASKEFTRQIVDAAVAAAKEANSRLQPVRVGIAAATLDVNFNRNQRLPGDDKHFFTVLEHRFMEKSMDSQPACKDLGALVFTDAGGKVVATVVSYAGHANMMCRLSEEATADWPGWTSRIVEAKTGGICLTIPDAGGNVDMREFNVDYSSTIKAGRDVAAAALDALADPKRLKGIDVRGSGGIGIFCAVGRGSPAPDKTEPRDLPVRVLRLGPVAYIDGGGELFTEYAMTVKKSSALPYAFYCFSTGGYLPTPEIFQADAYGSKGRKSDWAQVVTDTSLKLLQTIKDGSAQPAP